MKLNEENRFKAFIYSNEKLYVDDTHYGAFIQIMIDTGIKEDCEFENIDEYEEIDNIDKNAVFGGFYKIDDNISPVVFYSIGNEKIISSMRKIFTSLFEIDDRDNIHKIF